MKIVMGRLFTSDGCTFPYVHEKGFFTRHVTVYTRMYALYGSDFREQYVFFKNENESDEEAGLVPMTPMFVARWEQLYWSDKYIKDRHYVTKPDCCIKAALGNLQKEEKSRLLKIYEEQEKRERAVSGPFLLWMVDMIKEGKLPKEFKTNRG